MTTELQWRRRWKPNLNACPWKPLEADIDDSLSPRRFLVKTKFDDNAYEFLVTDLTNFWREKLSDAALQKRISKLNPSIEAPLTKVLDQIKSNTEKPGKDTKLSLTEKNEMLVLEISSQLAGMPFSYKFHAVPAEKEVGRDHLTIPLMAMVGELYRQQKELVTLLAAKDRQIDDYKSQGAKVSRKFLETSPFDEIAFCNSMVTSKGFEAEVRTYGEKAFTSKGQDLYREIATKRAWLQSTPVKEGAVDLGEAAESMSGAVGAPSVESWSGRLPPSMAQRNNSPNKGAASNSSSPAKSPAKSPASSKGSSTDNTPVKDTELLRRQALERKLEQEEAKQKEKVKKKKLKF